MNERIEKAYESRPKNWVYNLTMAVIVVFLLLRRKIRKTQPASAPAPVA